MHAPTLILLAAMGLFSAGCRAELQSDGDAPRSTESRASAARVEIGSIRWFVDYEAAVEVGERENKALWVHFGENPG